MEEPKAVALEYNFRRILEMDEKILVFDFGGGTLDITLFHVVEKSSGHIKLQVISEGGEAYHGGDNIDEMLQEVCYEFVAAKTGQTSISPENMADIALRSREAKERLSGVRSFRIPFTFCIPPFVEQITREYFEELIANFIEKTRKLVLKALREAYTGAVFADDIDRVLLGGGSSRMPWVRDMLIAIFNDEQKIYISERAALDISLGATYYAAMKMGLLSSPDIEATGGAPKETEIVRAEESAAAETAPVLSSPMHSMNIEFEVTVPHDIGFEIKNGSRRSFFTMIRRGTPYALAKKSHVFTLSGATDAEMTSLDLKILERIDKEDKLDDCKLIGEVGIRGLPVRPSGKTRLRITLTVEEEGGMVRGSVEDLGFGGEFAPSGFNESFDPSRHEKRTLFGDALGKK